MRVLAFNCGSSSIKCAVLTTGTGGRHFELRIEGIGGTDPRLIVAGQSTELPAAVDDTRAIDAMMAVLRERWAELGKLDAIAHRVVHGGDRFSSPRLIDTETIGQFEALERLAPLHNPPALRTLRAARGLYPDLPQVAVFDTAFHSTLPPRAREYALPAEIRAQFAIRRYGFHGISHGDVTVRAAAHLQRAPRDLRIISCHLGSGASIAAVEYGRSVETSMGMTPLEGLVMGTRAGDLDPGILLELGRKMPIEALTTLLNKGSGLAGITGTSDMRAIERRAAEGDEPCRLALTLYTHRIRKYLGAYAAVMGGVDAIAFTGGVGEHSSLVRQRSLDRLDFLGALLDTDANREVRLSEDAPLVDIARADSRVRLLVLRADEERAMANEAAKLLAEHPRPKIRQTVPVAISARHAHLSRPTLERLFGAGYQLRPRTPLYQTGQFSAEETVRLIGPRGSLSEVRLLGPPGAQDQIEISRSDEFALGIDAPVRISGDLANTPGVILEGPLGRVTLTSGLICARRHIHMNPHDAMRLGVRDRASVSVKVDSDGRDVVFRDVTVRVAPGFRLELHIDTDEANAAGLQPGDHAEIVSA